MDALQDNPPQDNKNPELITTKPTNKTLELDSFAAQQKGDIGHVFDVPAEATVLNIGQRGIGIASVSEHKQILQTQELGTCVALGLYDRQEGVAALMHIDSLTDVSAGVGMFLEALTDKNVPIEVTIIGGTEASDGDKQKSASLIASTTQTLNEKLAPLVSGVKLTGVETFGVLKRQVLLDVTTGITTVLYYGFQPTAHPFYEPNTDNDPYLTRSHDLKQAVYLDTPTPPAKQVVESQDSTPKMGLLDNLELVRGIAYTLHTDATANGLRVIEFTNLDQVRSYFNIVAATHREGLLETPFEHLARERIGKFIPQLVKSDSQIGSIDDMEKQEIANWYAELANASPVQIGQFCELMVYLTSKEKAYQAYGKSEKDKQRGVYWDKQIDIWKNIEQITVQLALPLPKDEPSQFGTVQFETIEKIKFALLLQHRLVLDAVAPGIQIADFSSVEAIQNYLNQKANAYRSGVTETDLDRDSISRLEKRIPESKVEDETIPHALSSVNNEQIMNQLAGLYTEASTGSPEVIRKFCQFMQDLTRVKQRYERRDGKTKKNREIAAGWKKQVDQWENAVKTLSNT